MVIKCDVNHPFVTIMLASEEALNCFCDDPNRPPFGADFLNPCRGELPGWGALWRICPVSGFP